MLPAVGQTAISIVPYMAVTVAFVTGWLVGERGRRSAWTEHEARLEALHLEANAALVRTLRGGVADDLGRGATDGGTGQVPLSPSVATSSGSQPSLPLDGIPQWDRKPIGLAFATGRISL